MSQLASAGKSVMVQGRIVWTSGSLFAGRPKVDMNTRLPKHNAQGLPITEYGFGLAVPKSSLAQAGPGQPGEIWTAIHEEAYTLYPNRQIPPNFAMKYKDGDGIDNQGQPFALREGYANHLVFACTTTLPIKYYKHENGQYFLINEGIKCGDYVSVQLHIKAHPPFGAGRAGLYLNPNAVLFLGFGKEIINSPSGDQIFGSAPPPMPPGASAVPLAPAGGFLVPQPAVAPQMPAAPPMPQQAQPHYAVVPQQFQPPPGVAPAYPAPQAPPMPQQAPAMPGIPGVPQPH